MIDREPVSVIVNVYNEAATIERELREIHAEIIARLPGSELIVAEDGSTDGTKEILERLKGELGIIHSTAPERKGYAKAFRDAVMLARNPYVFFSDTGGKLDFKEFWKLYEHRRQYAVISGTRNDRTDQRYRRILTWSYNFFLRCYFGVELRDADAGFRLYRADAIRKIAAEPWVNKHLIASELALRAIYSGFEVKEIPVAYRQRAGISRGLPPQKIPRVICSVVGNFSSLKKTLRAPGYRSGLPAGQNRAEPALAPPSPAADMAARSKLSTPAKAILSLLGVFALAMLLVNACTMTICEDETGGFYLDVLPTGEVFQFLIGNQSEDPPLYDLIQHLWVPWIGHSVVLLRALPVVFWLAMLPGIFLVGRQLGGSKAAWLTLAAVLLMPYHWTIPAVARWYSLYACLAVWNFWFFLRILDAADRPEPARAGSVRGRMLRWAPYVLTGACLWYTNYSAVVLFFTHLIVALFRSGLRWTVVRKLAFCWTAIGLLFLPWLPTFLRQLGLSTHAFSPSRAGQAIYCLVAGEFSTPYHLAFSLPALGVCLLLAVLVIAQWRRCWIPAVISAVVLAALLWAGVIGPKRLTLASPFLALTIGLALGAGRPDRGRWLAVARAGLVALAICVAGGATVNIVRQTGWLTYRWLDPCAEAARRAQAEMPDAVVITNSNPVFFYLNDTYGMRWYRQMNREGPKDPPKAVGFPLTPFHLQRLEQLALGANRAVWIHHSAYKPVSTAKPLVLATMERLGYRAVRTETMLRAAPEFLQYHPRFRDRALDPLDEYRVVLVYFAKSSPDELAARPDGATR